MDEGGGSRNNKTVSRITSACEVIVAAEAGSCQGQNTPRKKRGQRE